MPPPHFSIKKTETKKLPAHLLLNCPNNEIPFIVIDLEDFCLFVPKRHLFT